MKQKALIAALIAGFALPIAVQANPYFQNYTGQLLTVAYQYCNIGGSGISCEPELSAQVGPNSAYQVPAPTNNQDTLVQILSAKTTDGWNYAGPGGNDCDPWYGTLPQFANFSKSLVPNQLQCSSSIGASKK